MRPFRGVRQFIQSGGTGGEIAAASKEQAQGIEQINRAVTEMEKVTQANAATAEESAAAAEELNAQAEQMAHVSRVLAGIVGGNVEGTGQHFEASLKSERRVSKLATLTTKSTVKKALPSPVSSEGFTDL